jgi:hypothetical protein
MSPVADGTMMSWQHYPTPHCRPVPTQQLARLVEDRSKDMARWVYSSARI